MKPDPFADLDPFRATGIKLARHHPEHPEPAEGAEGCLWPDCQCDFFACRRAERHGVLAMRRRAAFHVAIAALTALAIAFGGVALGHGLAGQPSVCGRELPR